MRDKIDESLNELLGSHKSLYSAEEIEAAKKLKKQNGGTLMENLIEVTGRSMPDMNDVIHNSNEILKMSEQAGIELDRMLVNNQAQLSKDITEMTRNLENDFGVTSDNAHEVAAKAHDHIAANKPVPKVSLESFNGLAGELEGVVYGQDAFLNKLMISFKRPFVMPVREGMPKNCIYVTGPVCTGRHFALNKLSEALEKRSILRNGTVRYIDLSLYPTAAEEKLFLQDLYSALCSSADVIAFENYTECHASFLSSLTELVITGKCSLSARYIEQNGQLINVSNALASDAVGSLTARGKYLIFISTEPVSKLAGALGAPFVDALKGDICETIPLEKDSLEKISRRELEKLIEKSAKQLSFKLSVSDSFIPYTLSCAEKNVGLKGILDFYNQAYTSLAQLRLERELQNDTGVSLNAEAGTVYAIKNDPRYGLTVIINHDNGYQTVYSNLYTAEFIKEGEEVDKGQTIGTIGDTASFEIADEPHLHFEIYKNGENVNPTIYLKDN